MHEHRPKLRAQGTWEVKRRVTLPAATHERDAQLIAERLGRLPGVSGMYMDVRRHRLSLVYDVTRLDYRQLLEALAEAGYPVSETRWSRWKASWLQGLDDTARDNANAPEAPCCSNPKGIAPSRK